MPKFQDLTNQKFNRLLVLEKSNTKVSGRIAWKCLCDCGGVATILGKNLKSGNTTSCGCRLSENKSQFKHGLSDSKIYSIWAGILARCNNPKDTGYAYYGGKGVTVCDRWKVFENFLEDVGFPPTDDSSIDRINVNGNYEPHNVRWATLLQQARNKRNTVYWGYKGVIKPSTEWAELLGISYDRLYNHIERKNISLEECLLHLGVDVPQYLNQSFSA